MAMHTTRHKQTTVTWRVPPRSELMLQLKLELKPVGRETFHRAFAEAPQHTLPAAIMYHSALFIHTAQLPQ